MITTRCKIKKFCNQNPFTTKDRSQTQLLLQQQQQLQQL